MSSAFAPHLTQSRAKHVAKAKRSAKTKRTAQTKNGFAPKICSTCVKPFEWRKKWARNWPNVRYCSERCRRDG
ncbi:MAG TPA: DUF2256 domain-containing protein [Acidimicrobium sp.]|nr:DUF2256 domain-containing protein [Acidimicrobium sp.]